MTSQCGNDVIVRPWRHIAAMASQCGHGVTVWPWSHSVVMASQCGHCATARHPTRRTKKNHSCFNAFSHVTCDGKIISKFSLCLSLVVYCRKTGVNVVSTKMVSSFYAMIWLFYYLESQLHNIFAKTMSQKVHRYNIDPRQTWVKAMNGPCPLCASLKNWRSS
jgi:hypothetical protein